MSNTSMYTYIHLYEAIHVHIHLQIIVTLIMSCFGILMNVYSTVQKHVHRVRHTGPLWTTLGRAESNQYIEGYYKSKITVFRPLIEENKSYFIFSYIYQPRQLKVYSIQLMVWFRCGVRES